jgi:hypothetical protein
MARTKLKGEVIPLRLPLGVDGEVRARADALSMSASAFLANWVCRAWTGVGPTKPDGTGESIPRQPASNVRTTPEPVDTRQPRPRVPMPSAACSHLGSASIAGGMRKCVKCGAVRGADGAWR